MPGREYQGTSRARGGVVWGEGVVIGEESGVVVKAHCTRGA